MSAQAQEILPAVAVIIFDAQGRVEPGETVRQAAVREVKEETGLDIEVKRLIGVYSDPQSQTYHYPDGRTVQYITTYFEGRLLDPSATAQPAASPETLALAYFSPTALPADLIPMHPNWLTDAIQSDALPFIR